MPSPSMAPKKTRPKDSIKAQRDKAPVTLIPNPKSSAKSHSSSLSRAQKSPSVVWRTPSQAKLTQHHRHSLTIPSSSKASSSDSQSNYRSQLITAQNALTSSSTLPAQRNKSQHEPIPTFSSMSFSSSNSIRSHTSMNSTYL